MARYRVVVPVALLAVLAASTAAAQWVRLQRCAGAIPCSIPFGVVYSPDPLLGAQYGYISPTGISGRIALDGKPVVELDVHYTLPDFAREAAAKSFVLAHTPPAFPPPPPPKPAD